MTYETGSVETLNFSATEIESLREAFYAKTDHAANGCVEWRGIRNSQGYGQYQFQGRTIGAHRMAYLIATGLLPKSLQICHRCDNPPCVNANHLFAGTAKDNAQDKERKGRGTGGRSIYINALKSVARGAP